MFCEMYACLWVLITSWINRAIPSYILPCRAYKPQDTGVLRSDQQIYPPEHWYLFEEPCLCNKFNFVSISKKQEWWGTEISIRYKLFSSRQISILLDWLWASYFRNYLYPSENRELTTHVVYKTLIEILKRFSQCCGGFLERFGRKNCQSFGFFHDKFNYQTIFHGVMFVLCIISFFSIYREARHLSKQKLIFLLLCLTGVAECRTCKNKMFQTVCFIQITCQAQTRRIYLRNQTCL